LDDGQADMDAASSAAARGTLPHRKCKKQGWRMHYDASCSDGRSLGAKARNPYHALGGLSAKGPALHILILPSWYPTATAPTAGVFFREQAQALRQAGIRVGVVYPDMRSLRTLRLSGLSANRFQITGTDENGLATLRYNGWALPKLRSLHQTLWVRSALALTEAYLDRVGRPDLVHAHGARLAGVGAQTIRARLGLPYLLTEHASAFARGDVPLWEKPRVTAAFAGAMQIMAVSPAMAEMLRPYVGDRVAAIVPNLANTTFFLLPPAARAAPPFRFLAVSALTPKKAVHVLIRAFAEAFRDRPHVLLEIGGDGPERPTLIRLAHELGVGPQVRFLGRLSRPAVRDAMWRAHRFVLTSPWESFSVVLLEAMSTGLRVIATRSGGPESIVTDEGGRLVPVGRLDALATAMVEEQAAGVLDGTSEEVIRRSVEQRFGPAAFAEKVARHYREAIAAAEKGEPAQTR
jgi:glycosyltransferase involved in cell wall biosynthesis